MLSDNGIQRHERVAKDKYCVSPLKDTSKVFTFIATESRMEVHRKAEKVICCLMSFRVSDLQREENSRDFSYNSVNVSNTIELYNCKCLRY